jgi:hypothetical protein
MKNHDSINSVAELELGEHRNVLFNGQIFKCKILEIKSRHAVIIEMRFREQNFKTTVSTESIYREKP